MKVFLDFENMISPIVIKVLYWIGIVLMVILAVFGLIASLATGQIGGAFGSLVLLVLGPIAVRVYAELLMLAFKILDTLKEIRDKR